MDLHVFAKNMNVTYMFLCISIKRFLVFSEVVYWTSFTCFCLSQCGSVTGGGGGGVGA